MEETEDDCGCSHPGCKNSMPKNGSVPPGWTVARVEVFSKGHVDTFYVYLCPDHKISSEERQGSLFQEEPRT